MENGGRIILRIEEFVMNFSVRAATSHIWCFHRVLLDSSECDGRVLVHKAGF
jgi:hypothetical protein